MIHPNLNANGISSIWGTFINNISNEREKFQVFNGVHYLEREKNLEQKVSKISLLCTKY